MDEDENSKNLSSSQESIEDAAKFLNMQDVGSDDEDMMSGLFLDSIKKEQDRAVKERKFLMKELKAKERRGSIFIDKVNKVVATVQREPGIYDYLLEWKYCKEDKLVPTTSLVKGSHFAFSKPLLYRRHVEQKYIEKLTQMNNKNNQINEGNNNKITSALDQSTLLFQ